MTFVDYTNEIVLFTNKILECVYLHSSVCDGAYYKITDTNVFVKLYENCKSF